VELGDLLSKDYHLKINDQIRLPDQRKVDFVYLTRGGITIRSVPAEEDIENAMIGISCIYETNQMPDSIVAEWHFFPDSVTMIEASAVDPHGTFTTTLKPDNHKLVWESSINNYRVPVLESIKVEPNKYPLVSIAIWIFIIIYILLVVFKNKKHQRIYWLLILFYIGIMSYPFFRQEVSGSFSPHITPSTERTTVIVKELLNNVYRAFDRKEEALVYDCLALSVTGDQLTEVYIQNRKAMELEDRGGARVKVNEVLVKEIYSINREENGMYTADALWTVAGSVNHFGHTHYRQNKHRAMISFLQQEGIWKIVEIESFDVERVY